jgi:hypothetical protein
MHHLGSFRPARDDLCDTKRKGNVAFEADKPIASEFVRSWGIKSGENSLFFF